MAKQDADNKSVFAFFSKLNKVGRFGLNDVSQSGEVVELYFERKYSTTQQTRLKESVLNLLNQNFVGSYDLKKITYDGFESILPIEVTQSGVAGPVPTAIQEAGTAFILSQRVLRKNVKYTSAESIMNDKVTMDGLKKIFTKAYEDSIRDWVYTYFQHQKAFFNKFSLSDYKEFEHGGQDFMTFIKEHCENVQKKTPSGKLKPAKYETWNPTDIWVAKNMTQVKQSIDKAIEDDGLATLVEFNAVLRKLMEQKKLIGLSLKKIEPKASANFAYVNKEKREVEFSDIEELKMSDIDFEIKTGEQENGLSMNQGAYALYGKYTMTVIRTPTAGFSNLKFESIVKGSGGRGGAAPVDMVDKMMQSRLITKTFTNKHQDYPESVDDFKSDRRDYKKMYDSLDHYIDGTRNYEEFKDNITKMYRSKNQKYMAVAQSKLMQLNFFYDTRNQNIKTLKGKRNPAEFWTDLLFLSLKVGSAFAPHGKLS